MSTFTDIFLQYSWDGTQASIYNKTERDVEAALRNPRRGTEDFKALISPAAAPYLGEMAQMSHDLTKQRFGKTIQLFVPMYLSNKCSNICTYCGFSMNNRIPRKTLAIPEIERETDELKKMGFDHVLLVTGEANSVGMDYFREVLPVITARFSHVAMEVQPLYEEQYAELKELGVNTVLLYQETYNRESYAQYHTSGRKSNFIARLETPEGIGKAGMFKMGLGALLGLDDWRTDSFFVALHLDYLEKTYWQTVYSVSFPRIRPYEGNMIAPTHMTEKELVQLICAYRLWNQELDLSVSTRESQVFRDHIVKLGATTLSAGSKTNPGGYAVEQQSLEQFSIDDNRSPEEVANMVRQQGYDPVWKNWDMSYTFVL